MTNVGGQGQSLACLVLSINTFSAVLAEAFLWSCAVQSYETTHSWGKLLYLTRWFRFITDILLLLPGPSSLQFSCITSTLTVLCPGDAGPLCFVLSSALAFWDTTRAASKDGAFYFKQVTVHWHIRVLFKSLCLLTMFHVLKIQEIVDISILLQAASE